MDLLREWRRRIAGGTAAALIIPAAIVIASLGIGLGGGIGGLGALGQALTGPEVPGVEPASSRTSAADDEPGELLAAAAAAAARNIASRSRTTDEGARGPATPGARTRRPDRPQRPRAPRPPGAGRPPSAPPAPQPTPAPTEPPSTVRQVGDTVKEVTDDVPIAGEPAGQVVDIIVETAETLPLP